MGQVSTPVATGVGRRGHGPWAATAGSLFLFPAPPSFLPLLQAFSGLAKLCFRPPPPRPRPVQGVRFAERGRGWSNEESFPIPEAKWWGPGRIRGPCRKVDGQLLPKRGKAVELGALRTGELWLLYVLRCVKAAGIWGRWGLRCSVSGGRILSP